MLLIKKKNTCCFFYPAPLIYNDFFSSDQLLFYLLLVFNYKIYYLFICDVLYVARKVEMWPVQKERSWELAKLLEICIIMSIIQDSFYLCSASACPFLNNVS